MVYSLNPGSEDTAGRSGVPLGEPKAYLAKLGKIGWTCADVFPEPERTLGAIHMFLEVKWTSLIREDCTLSD